MKNAGWLIGLVGVLMLGAGTANAKPDAATWAARARAMMEAADTNKDGSISKAEHTAFRAANFAKLDVDQDGALSDADRKKAEEARMKRVGKMDQDGDGRITKGEFMAGGEAMFSRLDANKDNTISPDEMKKH